MGDAIIKDHVAWKHIREPQDSDAYHAAAFETPW